MDVKGIIKIENGEIIIKSNLPFLDEEFFKKHIKDKPYVKIKGNLWAIKSKDKYIIDDFDGVDILVDDLKKESIYDFLTQCYNKKEIELLLDRFLKESIRYGTPLSIMMIDIDYFKKVNDNYGHLAGDFILKEVAQIIKNNIRKSDACGRFGGEEFLIVLPNTSLYGAIRLAQRIKENIKNHKFIFHNIPISITVSIGITSAKKDDTIFSLIERADEALYEAKRKGRDRIEYH